MCECYTTITKFRPIYHVRSGKIIEYQEEKIGICYGTKDREECLCEGDCMKCDFYDEVRAKANREHAKQVNSTVTTYFAKEAQKSKLTPIGVLNFYRNFYRTENNNTEQGIVVNAINEVFKILSAQEETIKKQKETIHKYSELVRSSKVAIRREFADELKKEFDKLFDEKEKENASD